MSELNNPSFSQSPHPPLTIMVPIFPVEILETIISNVSDVPTLFNLLTLSRTTHGIVEANIYRNLDFSDADSLHISPSVYRRLSALSQHLLVSPYHASLVHTYSGMLWNKRPIVREESETNARALPLDQMPSLFTRLKEIDLSYDPFISAMPTNRGHFHAAVQCTTQELRVLTLDSQTICALASHANGLSGLRKLVWRQKQLKVFRVLPFYSQYGLPYSRQMNTDCIEGSFWTLNSVLPTYVYPRKLRFFENADPFPQDFPVRQSLLQRLQHVRVLSYRCSSEEGTGKYSVFIPIFADLPLLEVLELEFDDTLQPEWLHWAISQFSLGCSNIKKLAVSSRVVAASPGDLIGQSVFLDIGSLNIVILEMEGVVCWQKKRGDLDWQQFPVREHDWWMYE
ncbi:hypothetical protein DL96DRAFT_1622198 [Flagelloscypha sp. PMI_526]|nr:hypothetical protein DL96DRAFT_1622198 [Flagelloscypha sp. PMI_526]